MKVYLPDPTQAAHLPAPGPRDLGQIGTQLWDQSCGSGSSVVLLQQPHPHYRTQKGSGGGEVMRQMSTKGGNHIMSNTTHTNGHKYNNFPSISKI